MAASVSLPTPDAATIVSPTRSGPIPWLLGAVIAAAALSITVGGFDARAATQIAVTLAALTAVSAWLLRGSNALSLGRWGWASSGLFVAATAWALAGIGASTVPGQSWLAANHMAVVTVLVVLGLACGACTAGAARRVGGIALWSAVAAVLVGLAGRVAPALFDDRLSVARLDGPGGQPEALAVLCAMVLPIALQRCVDDQAPARPRLLALIGAWVLMIGLALAAARGAGLAAVFGLIVFGVLRSPGAPIGRWALSAAFAAAPVLALVLARPCLSDDGVAAADRGTDGLLLGGVLAVCAALVLILGRALLRADAKPLLRGSRSRLVRVVSLLVLIAVAIGLGVTARSEGGIAGGLERLGDRITAAPKVAETGPGRWASTNDDGRWELWRQAAAMVAERPVLGVGAGGFAAEHLRYRDQPTEAQGARNQLMTWLAEGGIVGALLPLSGLVMLWVAAVLATRRLPGDNQARESAAALVAAATAWIVAGAAYDVVTQPSTVVPALLFLGIAAGGGVRVSAGRRPSATSGTVTPRGPQVLLGVAAAVGLVLMAASVVLPAQALRKAQAASALAAGASPSRQQSAALDAALATRLDPIAADGPIAKAQVAGLRGRLTQARVDALEAVSREPDRAAAWIAMAQAAKAQADRAGYATAAQRTLLLDPVGPTALALVADAATFEAPPAGSPTATGTPLTARDGGTPAFPGSVTGTDPSTGGILGALGGLGGLAGLAGAAGGDDGAAPQNPEATPENPDPATAP